MIADAAAPIRSILVVGAGIVGRAAALAFARALPDVSVGIVATPPDPAALADRLPAALPATVASLDSIGIDETDLIRVGAASHWLGDRFAGWPNGDAAWVRGFGDTGVAIGGAAFHQHWLDARRAGARTPFHRFMPAAALAEAGHFVHPSEDERALLSRFAYGLRIDPAAALTVIDPQLAALRVPVFPTRSIAAGRAEDGGIDGLSLDDGRALVADFYVDCSGPAALLAAKDAAWQDWSDVLPVDRLLVNDTGGAPSLLDDHRAVAIGWRASWSFGSRSVTGLGYADAAIGEARARRVFGTGGGDATLLAIRPGRRRMPWHRNMLALGDAAVVAGPFGLAGFAVAQADLALALELLPRRDFHPLILAEYNRRVAQRANRVRDFLALHYLGATIRGEFWQALRGRVPSAELAETLAVFDRRGHLPRHEDEVYDKQSWLATLIGLGRMPAGRDPAARGADPAEVRETMARLAAAVADLPRALPPYPDYLARMRTPT